MLRVIFLSSLSVFTVYMLNVFCRPHGFHPDLAKVYNEVSFYVLLNSICYARFGEIFTGVLYPVGLPSTIPSTFSL